MILEAKDISKYFIIERGIFKRSAGVVCALKEVNFSLEEFHCLGIVGESGSGKTTLAKILLKLIPPSSGEIIYNPEKIKNLRKDIQIIFQNPYNSLDPKMRIIDTIIEPLLIHRIVPARHLEEKARELLETVGLEARALNRYPQEFSGGERQRICIARALAPEPRIIVLDEPISSLDLTIQLKLLDLFLALKEKFRLTYVFISHNLSVVKYITDSVLVMTGGRIVEQAKTSDIFSHPRHSYTQALLDAARG